MPYCPICNNESIVIWEEKKYKVYRCKVCTTAFLYPALENPEKIYDEKYFKNWYLKYYDERKKYFEKLWRKIGKFIPEKGRLLDIGCGPGIFMDVAKKKGWVLYGQDVSPFAVRHCREKGYAIYDKPLTEISLPENSFDVITMFDVIAHLKDPVKYIEKIKSLLKPEGVLIIKTPCHSNLLFFLANLASFTGKGKTLLHIPAQVYHFDTDALKIFFRLNGLSLLHLEKIKDFLTLNTKNPKILLSNMQKLCMIERSVLAIVKPSTFYE